jgi:RNA polymerase sigma-70 factor (ECF subfamily)
VQPVRIPLRGSAHGSTAALEDLARREFRSLVALGAALTGSLAVGEELAQEALLAAVRHWGKVQAYERPEAWLRRVVINAARSQQRRRVRERDRLADVAGAASAAVRDAPGFDAELWAAVRALPRRQAEVIALFYALDHSLEQIAGELGIGVGSAKTHLHRGLAHLRVTAASWEDRS